MDNITKASQETIPGEAITADQSNLNTTSDASTKYNIEETPLNNTFDKTASKPENEENSSKLKKLAVDPNPTSDKTLDSSETENKISNHEASKGDITTQETASIDTSRDSVLGNNDASNLPTETVTSDETTAATKKQSCPIYKSKGTAAQETDEAYQSTTEAVVGKAEGATDNGPSKKDSFPDYFEYVIIHPSGASSDQNCNVGGNVTHVCNKM